MALSPSAVEHIQVADSVPLSIIADIDVAYAIVWADWTPSGFPNFLAKWGAAGQRSWLVQFDGSGTPKPYWAWTTNGTTVLNALPTVQPGFADATLGAIRITFDVADGANRVTRFYKLTGLTYLDILRGALLRPLSEWTLYDTVTTAGTTSIFDSTSPVSFSSQAGGALPLDSQIVGCAIRDGIEGTLVLDYRAGDATGPYDTVAERANGASVFVTSGPSRGNESRYAPVFGHSDVLSSVLIANWTCGRSGVITYHLSSTNSDLSGGADFNKKLLEETETSDSIVIDVAEGATDISYGFTEPGEPGVNIPTGNYSVEVNVTAADAQYSLSIQLRRVNSAGTVQTSSAVSAEQSLAATGVKTFSFTALSLGAWLASDRLRVDYRFRRSSP